MGKNQPFNQASQEEAGSGLRTSGLRTGGVRTGGVRTGGVRTGELQFHKPFVKIGREANAEPAEFHRTAIKTSRNEFPVETSVATPCAFGDVVRIAGTPPAKGIRGGLITCGDKNFNVADYQIGGSGDGPKVIYITIPCEANMDDDSELILSGIKTSSAASLTGADWTVADSYPDNTNPTVASAGIGTFIFPIGSITITSGAASNFVPTGCGTCNISQCAGTLGHTRG